MKYLSRTWFYWVNAAICLLALTLAGCSATLFKRDPLVEVVRAIVAATPTPTPTPTPAPTPEAAPAHYYFTEPWDAPSQHIARAFATPKGAR